ncbi:MAG: methylamine utilization protein [Thermoanaerobaculia bacterium]
MSAIAAVLVTLPLGAATIEVRVARAGGAPVNDAVVYAVPATPLPLARKVGIMDQVDRMFVPHVLPVQTGTWVEFPNSDNIRHQVFSLSPARRFQLPLYVGKPARPIQFPEAGIVAIGCNIHEQMSGFIIVVDTPYFATTREGQATLDGIVAGEYTVRVWYPGMKTEPEPQVVKLGGTEKKSLSIVAR